MAKMSIQPIGCSGLGATGTMGDCLALTAIGKISIAFSGSHIRSRRISHRIPISANQNLI